MKYLIFFLLLPTVIISGSCNRRKNHALDNENVPEQLAGESTFTADSGQVARAITYDVIVRNPNRYDTWTTTCLQGFDRSTFVEEIFRSIYNGKLKAVDYVTDKELSPEEVQQMEQEILKMRNRIAKIQFTEDWYLDTASLTMQKEVRSMVLGYEVYGDSGQVRGYRPAFRINLNTK